MCSNEYREELNRIRFTEDSRRSLAEGLAKHRHREAPRPCRRSKLWERGLVAAAAVCLLATAAVAMISASPVLEDYFGGGAGYGQSAIALGQSVTRGGWTMTLTDCVADDYTVYVGIALAAPEGTSLDCESGYCFEDWNLPAFQDLDQIGGAGIYEQIEDDDPTDNTICFVLTASYLWNADFDSHEMELSFGNLYHIDENGERVRDCEETWRFSTALSLSDSIVRLEPSVPVTTLGVEAVITGVTVSPIGVYVRIEGDALIGHHGWTPRNAPDGWYGCVEDQEIILYTTDGAALPMMGSRSGSGCSGGDTECPEPGRLTLFRRSGALLDMDSLASVSVCGVEIPLK